MFPDNLLTGTPRIEPWQMLAVQPCYSLLVKAAEKSRDVSATTSTARMRCSLLEVRLQRECVLERGSYSHIMRPVGAIGLGGERWDCIVVAGG